MVEFITPLRPIYRDRRLTRVCEARLASIKMTEERLERMYKTRLQYLREMLDDRQSEGLCRTAESDLEPGFADFAAMPEIKCLIQNETEDITQKHFLTLQGRMGDLITSWTDHWRAVFTQMVLSAEGLYETIAEATSPLDLAVVSFTCRCCQQAQLRWPYILSHGCFRRLPSLCTICRREVHSKYRCAISTHVRYDHDAPYRGQQVVVSPNIPSTRAVIAACGLNPNTATYSDMEKCEARLMCLVCWTSKATEARHSVFAWQAAVSRYRLLMSRQQRQLILYCPYLKIQHWISSHPDRPQASVDDWQRISDSDAAMARNFEVLTLISQALEFPSSGYSEVVFGCTRCNYHGSLVEFQDHLRYV